MSMLHHKLLDKNILISMLTVVSFHAAAENTTIDNEQTLVTDYFVKTELNTDSQSILASNDTTSLAHDPTASNKATASEWLTSRKGILFSLSGELEMEYVDTQSNADANNIPGGYFQIDKFTVIPLVQIDKNITFGSLLLFKSTKARVDEVYLKMSDLPFQSQFKIGMDDRITNEWPKRRTEGFALIDSAFARDDEMGITWSRSRKKDFFWSFTLSNGYKLGQLNPSEDKSYKFIHDDRQTSDANQNKSLGLGIGWNIKPDKDSTIGVMVYGYSGKLSDDDVAFLQAVSGYGVSIDDTNNRYGLALNGKVGDWNFGAKNIIARDGDLERDGWFVQTGYTVKLKPNAYIQTIEPFIRHGELNVDLSSDPADSLTWDRSMTTLAVLLRFRKNFMIKVEYYLNGEETGASEVDNDEFVVQFEAKF